MRLVYYLLFISRLAVTSFSKYEVMKSCLYMVDRRMKEPEDTLTTHRIKRVFVVLLILRILWAVSTHQPQNEVVATITQVVQGSATGNVVAEVTAKAEEFSAGNVVAKVTKAQNARKALSDVEFEPAVKVAEVTAKAEEFSAGNVVAKVTKAQNARKARSDVEFEPAVKVAEVTAKAEEFSAGNVVAKVTKAQNARKARSDV